MNLSDYISIAAIIVSVGSAYWQWKKIGRQEQTINAFIIEKNERENALFMAVASKINEPKKRKSILAFIDSLSIFDDTGAPA